MLFISTLSDKPKFIEIVDDFLNSIKFDDRQISFIFNLLRHFPKLNNMGDKVLGDDVLVYPKKIGNLSIFSLFPLIKTSSNAGWTNQACKPVAPAEIIIITRAKKIVNL